MRFPWLVGVFNKKKKKQFFFGWGGRLMLLWSIWLGSKDTTRDQSKFTEEGRLRNWQCLAYYEKNLKGRVPENKEKRLRFLWLVAVFNQKNNFSWWGEWLIDANLIRVKKHQQRPIKIYLEEKTQLVQKLLFVITIIILMKQKLYHQYISGKKKRKTTLLGMNSVHLITPANIT